tara:strand:- start:2443 stop:4059 length:1617 start_codon:yes stop_codon:yes gene_type:complete
MAITLRNTKGTALTHVELDANFTTLQNADLDSAAISTIAQAAQGSIHLNTIAGDSDINFGTHKILYSNNYDSLGALPAAGTYHGMFAHVHGEGKAYYAHGGAWIKLADFDDVGTGIDSAKTISLVDSNYVSARIGSVGGHTDINMSGISNNQILKWDSAQGMFIAAADVSGGGGGGGLGYADFSVSTNAAGSATLSYNNGTGVFSYTPPDLSGYLTSYTETNDLSAAVTWANIPDANVPASAVTQHQGSLAIAENKISDSAGNNLRGKLQSYITGYTVTDSDVVAHQAALTITESQISDLGTYVASGSSIDMSGTELVMDADGDTSFHASVDDEIDIRVKGADVGKFDSDGLIINSIRTSTAGTPTLTSSSNINMTVGGSVTVSGGGFRVASLTTSQRGSLTAANGEIIYNTDNGQFEIYQRGGWTAMTRGASLFTLTASGSSHYIFNDPDGHWFPSPENDPLLYLRRGETYYFVNNSGGSHPFEIRASAGGSAYSTGVTNNGSSSGTITFKVPMSAPSTLYYQCTSHGSMGNTINII